MLCYHICNTCTCIALALIVTLWEVCIGNYFLNYSLPSTCRTSLHGSFVCSESILAANGLNDGYVDLNI